MNRNVDKLYDERKEKAVYIVRQFCKDILNQLDNDHVPEIEEVSTRLGVFRDESGNPQWDNTTQFKLNITFR